jgi:hypothetical protein
VVAKFYQILDARKRRRALVNIRREFATAGYPLDHFRDAQIEAALTRWNDDISAVTLSAKTIYRALKRLQRLARGERQSVSSAELLFSGGKQV